MADLTNPKALRRFFSLVKADRNDVANIYIYALFSGIVNLSLPLGIQSIINFIAGAQVSTSWIILVIIVIFGLAAAGGFQIMQLTITEKLQQKIFTRSAFDFAFRIPRMRLEAVDKYYVPELVNRFFDTLSVQKGISKILIDFSTASLQVIFGLALLSFYHPFFIIFSFLLIVLLYLIIRYTGPQGLKSSLTESHYKYEVAHWLEELARTMETFKLAGRTELPLSKTDELVSSYLSARRSHFRVLVTQYSAMVVFKLVVATGLLVLGGLLVIEQQLNIGQFVAAEIIIILILNSVEKLILIMESIYDVLTSLEKLGTVTDISLEKEDGVQLSRGLENEGLAVHVHELSYRFPGQRHDVLKNIELDIAPGHKVCVAGFNGAGKSLLLQMIAGLYTNYEGSVAYNKIPLGNLNVADLRSFMGDSLAKEDIFRGTLEENISMGRPQVPFSEVREVAHAVGLEDFVEEMEKGYQTMLDPEGRRLPNSIRQKIMLARAVAGNPRLILLEDTFMRLEVLDRQRFADYLFSRGWTIVAVSNDAQFAERCDRVIVLDNGRVLHCGTYQDIKGKPEISKVFTVNKQS